MFWSCSIKLKALKLFIIIVFSLFLIFCTQKPKNGPSILVGFSERVAALITTTIISNLRYNPPKQKLLEEKFPYLEKQTSFNRLIEELKKVDRLKDLAYIIEADIMFELQRSENQSRRENLNSPEVQKEILDATLIGIKKGLSQLKEEKDGK